MRRVLARAGDALFIAWWQAFMPTTERLAPWLAPVRVTDRSDPRIAHLDGLNLSRAWCWSLLIDAMPDAAHAGIARAIEDHLAASLAHAVEGEYVGTHWLASFAVLALVR